MCSAGIGGQRYFERAVEKDTWVSPVSAALNMDSALEAARIMRAYARNKGPRERVAPDFLIGAHAARQADALLTCDAGFYRHYFDGLNVTTPA